MTKQDSKKGSTALNYERGLRSLRFEVEGETFQKREVEAEENRNDSTAILYS